MITAADVDASLEAQGYTLMQRHKVLLRVLDYTFKQVSAGFVRRLPEIIPELKLDEKHL